MRARDIMTCPVHTVWQNTSVENAAEAMTAYAVTALPVLDSDGRLVGMVSESDLLWHHVAAEPGADPAEPPEIDPRHRPGVVADVMSRLPVTTTPAADVADVAEVMLELDVRSLPVMDGSRLVGIISRRDILRAMVRSDRTLAAEAQQRLDEFADGTRRWTATVDCGVVTVLGECDDDTERAIVAALARTVPGVAAVSLSTPVAHRSSV